MRHSSSRMMGTALALLLADHVSPRRGPTAGDNAPHHIVGGVVCP